MLAIKVINGNQLRPESMYHCQNYDVVLNQETGRTEIHMDCVAQPFGDPIPREIAYIGERAYVLNDSGKTIDKIYPHVVQVINKFSSAPE